MVGKLVHDFLISLMHLERRTEPYWRERADALLREPSTRIVEGLINLGRGRQATELAAEQYLPGEDSALDAIIEQLGRYMQSRYRNGEYERGGNTKTHGLVRAEVVIHDDLPAGVRHGIFAVPRTYPAWVRFGGPGPDSPPDIEEVGVLSMSVKLMDVPGPKLLDDERHTQDLLAVSTPTFVTPDAVSNAQLQSWVLERTPLYYFLDPKRTHLLDLLMQGLWSRTQSSPLECRYYSCVPYLLGQGRAMQYSMRPRLQTRSKIPGLPKAPSDHYLRENMAATLSKQDVEFELLIQVQTDAHAMPIEHAGVRWPQARSPWVPVATIRIPQQRFDLPAQLRFAQRLSFTPWHCVPEHRPLGNLNRARRRMYQELSRLRFGKNAVTHYEPTGRETFDDAPGAAQPAPQPSAKVPRARKERRAVAAS